MDHDFNSRTSCEVRPAPARIKAGRKRFQLTHLLRGATRKRNRWTGIRRFQLTHLLRGATTRDGLSYQQIAISTHAPLARCDACCCGHSIALQISTHAPLARCDIIARIMATMASISTHAPLARCDCAATGSRKVVKDFNSRTSCEVRHIVNIIAYADKLISTHAPLARCDGHLEWYAVQANISTHAPLARCDMRPYLPPQTA